MIDKYKDELLQSFLDNYCRIYLIDLEEDSIVKISETDDAPDEDPVHFGRYSEFNRVYSYTRLDPKYSSWRETMGSIENLRKVLADRSSFTLSYQMKSGKWMKVENRILEKKDGVPVKIFACIPKVEKGGFSESEKILKNGHIDQVAPSEKKLSQVREKLIRGVMDYDAISTFEVNLTRNTLVSAINRNDDLYYFDREIELSEPFDVQAAEWAKRVLSDNADQFRELINRQNLITLYGMGERDPWIEYMVQDRFGNRIWLREVIALSKNEESGDIMELSFQSRRAVAEMVCDVASREPADTAVLYRNNESALPIVNLLDRRGIPYRIKGNDTTFFSNPVIRDINAILRLALNGRDAEAFLQIYYKVGAYVTKQEAQAAASAYFTDNDFFAHMALNAKAKGGKIKRLWFVSYRLRKMAKGDAAAAIRIIRDELNYDKYMAEKKLDAKKADMY